SGLVGQVALFWIERVRGVAEILLRVMSRERPDGRDHAAVILEVVVAVEDVVLAVVLVLGGDDDAGEALAELLGRLGAERATPVGEGAPGLVHRREILVGLPVALVEQR